MTQQQEQQEAVITEEGIQVLRNRIGVEQPVLNPFNEVATKDAIRHYV